MLDLVKSLSNPLGFFGVSLFALIYAVSPNDDRNAISG